MSYVTARQPVTMMPADMHSLQFSLPGTTVALSGWDDPQMLTQYVKMSGPLLVRRTSLDQEQAAYMFMNRRVQVLEDIEAKLGRHICKGSVVELAAARFSRKLQAFRVLHMQDFPDEILRHIFQLATLANRDPYDSDVCLQRVHIASVCRHWRKVAQADQVLWSTVVFDPRTPWDEINDALELSGEGSALSVAIPAGNVALHSTSFEVIQETLEPYTTRVQSFYARISTWDDVKQLTDLVLSKLGPALKTFELSYKPGSDPRVGGGPFVAFSPDFLSSRVRNLVLTNTPCHFDRINLAELTSLELGALSAIWPSVFHLTAILRRCPHLRRLSLADLNPSPTLGLETGHRGDSALLYKLDEFSIKNCSASRAIDVMSQVQAPNLRGLALLRIDDSELQMVEWLTKTARFPRVQDLAFLEVQFKMGDMARIDYLASPANARVLELFRKWFLSMPRLRLLKLAKTHPIIFDTLGVPPYTGPPPAPAFYWTTDAEHKVPCPALRALHVEFMDAEKVASFMTMRAGLGLGFKKAFVGKDWWPQLTPDERRVLAATEVPWYVSKSWPGDDFITEKDHQEAMWGV